MEQTVRKMPAAAATPVNPSGIKPLGVAVLVKPYEPEVQKSIIALPDTVAERTRMVETRATVIAVGPWAWHEEPAPRAAAGDRVMFSKFAGAMIVGTKDGEQYRIINDRDIVAAISEEA